MANPSVFRDFIKALRKHWRINFPSIQPLETSLGPTMPKASTFYAGMSRSLEMHVFLHFQHSSMAWQVVQSTINVIPSRRKGAPEHQAGPFLPADGVPSAEGSYRIGQLLGRHKDKWWHLKDDKPPLSTEAWRPTGYDDYESVLTQAVADVTADVQSVLTKLQVEVHGK